MHASPGMSVLDQKVPAAGKAAIQAGPLLTPELLRLQALGTMPVIAAPPAYLTGPGRPVGALEGTQQESGEDFVPAAPQLDPLQPAKMALYRMVVEQVWHCTATSGPCLAICLNALIADAYSAWYATL